MESNGNRILWPILASVLIILTNAFFVMVEFAVVTVRKGQMDRLADEGHAGAAAASRLLADPDWAIAGSQLGITLASILLGIVAEEPLRQLLEPALTRIFGRVPFLGALAGGLSAIFVLLLLSFFHMVLGEQTPKTIALRFPARTAVVVAPPMLFFARLAGPLVWLVDKSTALVLRILGIGGQTGGHGVHTVDELKEVVLESQEEGLIPYADQRMLLHALDFGGRFVREAMIPRPDIVAVEQGATLGELLRIFKTSRHSRFPVYDDDLDNISGTISVKEVLPLLADDPTAVNRPLAELGLIRPALVVPESGRIGDLFNQMRRDREHMAIVLDEFGGTAGLVTAEELAEEVVGRLTDEWVTEGPQVKTVKENVFEIDAQTRVDEVNEGLGVNLPTSPDYETLAGFVLFHIRRIPKQGEVIPYETPGPGPNLRLTITKMIGPKIERIQVERL
jgi:CBS domain containing-hemolysin-like protein